MIILILFLYGCGLLFTFGAMNQADVFQKKNTRENHVYFNQPFSLASYAR